MVCEDYEPLLSESLNKVGLYASKRERSYKNRNKVA